MPSLSPHLAVLQTRNILGIGRDLLDILHNGTGPCGRRRCPGTKDRECRIKQHVLRHLFSKFTSVQFLQLKRAIAVSCALPFACGTRIVSLPFSVHSTYTASAVCPSMPMFYCDWEGRPRPRVRHSQSPADATRATNKEFKILTRMKHGSAQHMSKFLKYVSWTVGMHILRRLGFSFSESLAV